VIGQLGGFYVRCNIPLDVHMSPVHVRRYENADLQNRKEGRQEGRKEGRIGERSEGK